MRLISLNCYGAEQVAHASWRNPMRWSALRREFVRRLSLASIFLLCLLAGSADSLAAEGGMPSDIGPPLSSFGSQPAVTAAPLIKDSCVNGKPTDTTINQATSMENLQKFDVSSGSNSTLVSAHVATAFVPAWISKDSTRNGHLYNALGVDLSTAVPVASASLPAYAKQALLNTKGGVANFYFSAAGRNICNSVFDWEPRRTAVDHAYLISSPATGNELIAYVLDGIGIRAVKTALSGLGYGAVGTAYLGLGFDGPLFSFNGEAVGARPVNDSTGLMSLEVYAAENAINPHTLEALLGTKQAPSSFASVGVNLRVGLPGRFFLSIDFSKGIGGYAKARLGDLTLISIGYNRPSTATDAANK